jgi:xanthine dehydrogenase iron-sulfur cluster and FAD-binding subunit A
MLCQSYYQPVSLAEALELLRTHHADARVVAGGTDLVVEVQRGVRPTSTLIDISRLRELRYLRADGDRIALGGLTTHNDVLASPLCRERALPLVQACAEVGAPQIRTRATIAGNLVTASPANDTIPPLLALDAELVLASHAGQRVVPLRDFYPGFRRTALRPDELVREIRFAGLAPSQRGLFLKLGLRRAQAISVIDLAMVVTFTAETRRRGDDAEGEESSRVSSSDGATLGGATTVEDARIALGCLAPTVVRAPSAEAFLLGKRLTPEVCLEAGRLACRDVSPIDDLRGSARYRLATLASLVAHGLERLASGTQADGLPGTPVLLDTGGLPTRPQSASSLPSDRSLRSGSSQSPMPLRGAPAREDTRPQSAGSCHPTAVGGPGQRAYLEQSPPGSFDGTIRTTINGRPYVLANAAGKTLLDALREDAGLTGTKEGCAEGECGACTVWLDGQAVMSCLVPAPQAHNAALTTIEGLAAGERLHPLQEAFVACGAVQCGYCIPGMLMAGAKLLQEHPHPDLEQTRTALSGNICRCTGYRKILDAVQMAAGAHP